MKTDVRRALAADVACPETRYVLNANRRLQGPIGGELPRLIDATPGGECAAIGAGTAACNRFWCRLVEQGPPSRRARARGFARWGWRVCAGSSPTIHAVSLVRLTARSVFSVPCYSGQGATQGRDGGARTMIRHQIAKRLRHGWEIQCASEREIS